MAHNPVNHPARPVYRAIAGLIGLYLVLFGIIGVIQNAGENLFANDDNTVLGQGVNLGGSVLSVLLGVVILAATGLGRNIDVRVNKPLGYVIMALGLAELAVLRTQANLLDWSIATVIVTMLLGVTLLTVAMYSSVGSEDEAEASRSARLVL
ncbi:DUF4383 domain-containing protein [Plantactinospora siamensis]|uniref:DUF4383 domain-containing protein n=1 Tax=Plantactinospora siamensis TaxID=555372 RepID=A0ABV6NV29_9ACTN